jgi:AcrR family transcriptional regulator
MGKAADAPSRGHYHHGDLRHALLRAALGLVASRGAEGFSLREAAREVGVSPAAAYRHFEDKKALLAALAVDGMGRLALAMEQALGRAAGEAGPAALAVARLAAVGRAYVEFAVKHPAHFQVMFGPWCDHADLTEVPAGARPLGRDPYQILVEMLDAMVLAGVVSPVQRVGAEVSAWSAVHGLASLLVAEVMPLDPAGRSQAIDLVLRTELLGLGCPPALLGGPVAAPPADPRPGPGPKARRSARRATT